METNESCVELQDISKVASFDIDAQNTFTPVCPDELPVPEGDQIADELNKQARRASLRIGSKDAHSPRAVWVATDEKPQFSPIENEPDADIRWVEHAVPGTKGFELIHGLPKVIDYDYFVWKGVEPNMHPYGACYHDLAGKMSTGVIEFLFAKGIKTVIAGGLATDYCVKTTVLQLLNAGFDVIVNLGACRGIAVDTVEQALEEMKSAGARFVTTAQHIEIENI
ncbi:MAG: nicotinamidase [Gammaproteobacteria bacterium]|nr:MAG: nicotinamidase [Gammaproteobacteria bacterium]